jgi:hypothetical protein
MYKLISSGCETLATAPFPADLSRAETTFARVLFDPGSLSRRIENKLEARFDTLATQEDLTSAEIAEALTIGYQIALPNIEKSLRQVSTIGVTASALSLAASIGSLAGLLATTTYKKDISAEIEHQYGHEDAVGFAETKTTYLGNGKYEATLVSELQRPDRWDIIPQYDFNWFLGIGAGIIYPIKTSIYYFMLKSKQKAIKAALDRLKTKRDEILRKETKAKTDYFQRNLEQHVRFMASQLHKKAKETYTLKTSSDELYQLINVSQLPRILELFPEIRRQLVALINILIEKREAEEAKEEQRLARETAAQRKRKEARSARRTANRIAKKQALVAKKDPRFEGPAAEKKPRALAHKQKAKREMKPKAASAATVFLDRAMEPQSIDAAIFSFRNGAADELRVVLEPDPPYYPHYTFVSVSHAAIRKGYGRINRLTLNKIQTAIEKGFASRRLGQAGLKRTHSDKISIKIEGERGDNRTLTGTFLDLAELATTPTGDETHIKHLVFSLDRSYDTVAHSG